MEQNTQQQIDELRQEVQTLQQRLAETEQKLVDKQARLQLIAYKDNEDLRAQISQDIGERFSSLEFETLHNMRADTRALFDGLAHFADWQEKLSEVVRKLRNKHGGDYVLLRYLANLSEEKLGTIAEVLSETARETVRLGMTAAITVPQLERRVAMLERQLKTANNFNAAILRELHGAGAVFDAAARVAQRASGLPGDEIATENARMCEEAQAAAEAASRRYAARAAQTPNPSEAGNA